MQQLTGRTAGTRKRTPWLMVLLNWDRPTPLLHSSDAQALGEDSVMDRE